MLATRWTFASVISWVRFVEPHLQPHHKGAVYNLCLREPHHKGGMNDTVGITRRSYAVNLAKKFPELYTAWCTLQRLKGDR